MAGDFSDEEWDFPDDELRALEHNAVVSTQQQIGRNGRQNLAPPSNSLYLTSTQRLETPAVQTPVANRQNEENDCDY